jgi:hypothetical protein
MILTGFSKEWLFLLHMQPGKSIKILLNYFLGPLLFGWLLFSLYQQISNQPHLAASWMQVRRSFTSPRLWYLAGALLLVAVNWGLESRKWQVSVAAVSPVSFTQAYKAVLSGVSFAVTTPNRMGEYLGRMLYLPDGSRLKSIAVTLVGSMSQLLITLFTGFWGLLFLRRHLQAIPYFSEVLYRFLVFGTGAGALLLTIFYFQTGAIGRLLNNWLRRTGYSYLIESLAAFSNSLLVQLLVWSGLRYCVFVVQYLLVFHFFDVHVPVWFTVNAVAVMFLAMAVIPSITLVEVGLRGEISLALMGLFSANSLGIGLSSVSIWFMNLVVPGVVGSVLILSVRVFQKIK